jgi:hypothetical protein
MASGGQRLRHGAGVLCLEKVGGAAMLERLGVRKPGEQEVAPLSHSLEKGIHPPVG